MTILLNFLFNIAALLGSVARTLVIQLATNIVTLLVITDPIIIMRNADVREAFNKLMKPCMKVCCKALQRKNQITEVELNNHGQNLELATTDFFSQQL